MSKHSGSTDIVIPDVLTPPFTTDPLAERMGAILYGGVFSDAGFDRLMTDKIWAGWTPMQAVNAIIGFVLAQSAAEGGLL